MYVSIDLGGTNTRVASSFDLENIHKIERFKTEKDLETQKNLIKQAVLLVCDEKEVQYTCLGVPGTLDRENKKFLFLPNYKILNGLPYSSFIDEKNLLVENDAVLAALGEAIKGAGRDFDRIAYLTLGSGVGSALIKNKVLDVTTSPAEFGHEIIIENGRRGLGCGHTGCLEAYTSGLSFHEMYKVWPNECNDQKIWNEYGEFLAMGLIKVSKAWSPEVIVLGGGISSKFEFFMPATLSYIKKQGIVKFPEVKKAELADTSGLVGGFLYLKQVLKV
jgi:glucokinase